MDKRDFMHRPATCIKCGNTLSFFLDDKSSVWPDAGRYLCTDCRRTNQQLTDEAIERAGERLKELGKG